MKKIKLSKEEGRKITENMRKHLGDKAVPKRIKVIKFHKDFEKGLQFCLCLNCGYPLMFQGLWDYPCDNCGSKRVRIYQSLEDFILKAQRVLNRNCTDKERADRIRKQVMRQGNIILPTK